MRTHTLHRQGRDGLLPLFPFIPAASPHQRGSIMKNNIKVQRAIKDVTQEELARKVGVTRQTINAIEKGKYNPSLDLAFKLAELFDMKIEELFFYRGDEDE
jgi:putative transcriptional regulator